MGGDFNKDILRKIVAVSVVVVRVFRKINRMVPVYSNIKRDLPSICTSVYGCSL